VKTETKDLNRMQSLFNMALAASEQFSEDLPNWIKPIGKLVVYIFALLFILLLFPFFILKRYHPKPYQKLKTELTTRWHSESSLVALNELRSVYKSLSNQFENVMLGGYKIEPYGKFTFYDYINVAELLYHWELQHNSLSEAIQVCDAIIQPIVDSGQKLKSLSEWIVRKACAISLLDGKVAAQEYLIKHVDPENKKCRIKSYLHELRKAS